MIAGYSISANTFFYLHFKNKEMKKISILLVSISMLQASLAQQLRLPDYFQITWYCSKGIR